MPLALLITLACAFSVAKAEITITQHGQLLPLLLKYNPSLSLAEQRLEKTTADAKKFMSSFGPNLAVSANYARDQQAPINAFMPSNNTNYSVATTLTQRSMLGAELSVGVDNATTKFTLASQDNKLFKPVAYLAASIDLSRNILGSRDLNTSIIKQLGVNIASLHARQTLEHSYLDCLLLFWRARANKEIIDNVHLYLKRLLLLEEDLKVKVARKIVEPGELASLQATISAKTAEILGLSRGIKDVTYILQTIIHTSEQLSIQPSTSMDEIMDKVIKAEQEILQLKEHDPSYSSANVLEYNNMLIAAKQAKSVKLEARPEIKLEAKYAATGQAEKLSNSYDKLLSLDNPQYSIGVSINLPIYASHYRSLKRVAVANLKLQQLNQKQVIHNIILQIENAKADIYSLLQEDTHLEAAIEQRTRHIVDLRKRYHQGRISLFELVLEEGQLLAVKVQRSELWITRISKVVSVYKLYDKYNFAHKFTD